jgi:phosphatidate cytidylyltransferase
LSAAEESAASVSTPAKTGSGWSLRLRVVSGLIFVPLLILLARAGGIAFVAFVGLQVYLGMGEFYRMMRGRDLNPSATLGILAGLVLLFACYRPHRVSGDALTTALVMVLLALSLRHADRPRQVENIAATLFGLLYVGWLSAHLVLLRELPWIAGTDYRDGASYVLLAFFVTWSCDTGAYAIGRWLGRTRPWTRISPRKSVEGSAGGLVSAVIAAYVARAWFAPYLSPVDAAVLGLGLGIAGQVGDLVESLLKRHTRHGDSSDIIPGHGGILDRFDSLYFAAPVVYYYLRMAVLRVP